VHYPAASYVCYVLKIDMPVLNSQMHACSFGSNTQASALQHQLVQHNQQHAATLVQGTVYNPVTQKQADSAHLHERLAAHHTPMMLTSANLGIAAPCAGAPLGCTKTMWGLGNTGLSM